MHRFWGRYGNPLYFKQGTKANGTFVHLLPISPLFQGRKFSFMSSRSRSKERLSEDVALLDHGETGHNVVTTPRSIDYTRLLFSCI